MSDPCPICDRAECPRYNGSTFVEQDDATPDCAAHAVDWRARALAAEERNQHLTARLDEQTKDRARLALELRAVQPPPEVVEAAVRIVARWDEKMRYEPVDTDAEEQDALLLARAVVAGWVKGDR